MKEYFDSRKGENTAIIVDPAMADNGKLYVGFDEAFAKEMLNLCTKADITLPNISEAALMLGEEYPGEERRQIPVPQYRHSEESSVRLLQSSGTRIKTARMYNSGYSGS